MAVTGSSRAAKKGPRRSSSKPKGKGNLGATARAIVAKAKVDKERVRAIKKGATPSPKTQGRSVGSATDAAQENRAAGRKPKIEKGASSFAFKPAQKTLAMLGCIEYIEKLKGARRACINAFVSTHEIDLREGQVLVAHKRISEASGREVFFTPTQLEAARNGLQILGQVTELKRFGAAKIGVPIDGFEDQLRDIRTVLRELGDQRDLFPQTSDHDVDIEKNARQLSFAVPDDEAARIAREKNEAEQKRAADERQRKALSPETRKLGMALTQEDQKKKIAKLSGVKLRDTLHEILALDDAVNFGFGDVINNLEAEITATQGAEAVIEVREQVEKEKMRVDVNAAPPQGAIDRQPLGDGDEIGLPLADAPPSSEAEAATL